MGNCIEKNKVIPVVEFDNIKNIPIEPILNKVNKFISYNHHLTQSDDLNKNYNNICSKNIVINL
tara:strand:+ start:495 stop:686 length:192 start_codon:yes stop_codon:yes gene_type:complete